MGKEFLNLVFHKVPVPVLLKIQFLHYNLLGCLKKTTKNNSYLKILCLPSHLRQLRYWYILKCRYGIDLQSLKNFFLNVRYRYLEPSILRIFESTIFKVRAKVNWRNHVSNLNESTTTMTRFICAEKTFFIPIIPPYHTRDV